MKKIVLFMLMVSLMFSVLGVSAFAEVGKDTIDQSIEYLDDGYYVVTTLKIDEENITRATSSKTVSRTSVIYNSDDEALVSLKLTATFSYTGSSSTCTAASTSYTIHNNNWKVTSATATRSGNKATGNFVSKRYTLLIPVQTVESTITLSCSNTGTIS